MTPASVPPPRFSGFEWPVMALLTLLLLVTLYHSARTSQTRLAEARKRNDAALQDLKAAVNRNQAILPILSRFMEFSRTDADAAALVRKYGLVVQDSPTNTAVLPTHL